MVTVFAVLAALIYMSDYRLQRFLCFQDPWADPTGCGYQLVQALIAVGSGEWLGVGLGSSVQKLFYLPHANNDFLVAVIAEELGLLGIAVLVVLYGALLWRIFQIARRALVRGDLFADSGCTRRRSAVDDADDGAPRGQLRCCSDEGFDHAPDECRRQQHGGKLFCHWLAVFYRPK